MHGSRRDGYPDTSFEAFVTSRQSVPVVSVLEGKTTTGVFVKLGPKGGWLTGSVVDAKTGKPLPAATFKLIRAQNPGIWIGTELDEAGRLLIPSTVGFRLEVFAEHFRPWWFGGDQGERSQGILRLNPGVEVPLHIKLQPE